MHHYYLDNKVRMYMLCMCAPFESSLILLQQCLATPLYSHHNSKDMPKVYIASTMMETCVTLQYSSSSENAYV